MQTDRNPLERNQAIMLENPFALFRKKRINSKTLPREITTRENEGEENSEVEGVETPQAKDQI